MYPELFKLGPVTVYTYGVLLAAAYLLGLRLAMSRAKSRGLDPNRTLDLGIAIIISALVGAKLLLLLVDFDRFRQNPGELFSIVRSGGVFYGGLIAAVAVAFWYMWRHKMPLWTTCDVFAPGIALGHAVGRLGCLMAGCCYGRPTNVPWAITFTNPEAAANVGTPLGVALHPTQLYESAAEALILVLLLCDREEGAARSRAARSGATWCSTASRGSSSSSSAATTAAPVRRRLDEPVHLARARAAGHRHADLPLAPYVRSAARRRAGRTAGFVVIPMREAALEVAPEQAGERLDRYLASVLPGHSRSQVQRLIEQGHVRVEGREARANLAVKAGDRIAVVIPAPAPATPEAQDIPLTVLYEDADLIVIDKPAGMVVHPAAGHASGTLVNALLHHVQDLSGVGGELRPGIVHRLDKGTSGVMVVAKHDKAHEELARQFEEREVEKEYIALVWGVVQAGRRIDLAIGRDPNNRQKMSSRARRARSAVTRITKAHHLRGVTLCHVAIATGRTHQIRVHLSAIGHAIVGDATYGGARARVAADLRPVLSLDRPFLHAYKLALKHPIDGRPMQWEAPLAPDLQRVLDELEALQGDMDVRSAEL